MALEPNIGNLSDSGFGSGSPQGTLVGLRFGTDVNEIRSGDPVFPEHILRLYQVLSADTKNAEIGIDGLIVSKRLKVNEKIRVDDLEIEGNFTLSGGLGVPGNLDVDGDATVLGEFDFEDNTGSFGDDVAQAIEGLFTDSPDVSVSLSGSSLDASLNSDSVDENEINASGTGFLNNFGTGLSYDGISTSSEFSGQGTPGSQLSIADDSVGNAELEDAPSHSLKAADGSGDPFDQDIPTNSVVARVQGAIDDLQVGADEVVARGGGNLTAMDIKNTFKGLLSIQAEDVGAGSFDDGGSRFSFSDRLDLQGGLKLFSSTEIKFRESGNEAFIKFGTPLSDGKLVIDNTGNPGDNIELDTDGSVDVQTAEEFKVTTSEKPTVQFDDLQDFSIPAELQYDTNAKVASDAREGLFRATSNENVRVDADEDLLLASGERTLIDTNAPVLIGNGFGDSESVEEQIDDADIIIYDGFIIFKENGQHSKSNVGLSDTQWSYGGSNIQLMKEGEGAIFGNDDGTSDTDLGWIENTGGNVNKGNSF